MTFNDLLAQTTQRAAPTGTPAGDAGQQSNPMMLIIWLAMFGVIFWFLLLRPKQKEQKQRAQMLNAIKKYDKVMTIGGVIGTVMEVREEEIIVKVDDSTNTRIKFTRGAIQKVLSSAESEKEKPE